MFSLIFSYVLDFFFCYKWYFLEVFFCWLLLLLLLFFFYFGERELFIFFLTYCSCLGLLVSCWRVAVWMASPFNSQSQEESLHYFPQAYLWLITQRKVHMFCLCNSVDSCEVDALMFNTQIQKYFFQSSSLIPQRMAIPMTASCIRQSEAVPFFMLNFIKYLSLISWVHPVVFLSYSVANYVVIGLQPVWSWFIIL